VSALRRLVRGDKNFRVAHIHPFARELQRFDSLPDVCKLANWLCELVFAAQMSKELETKVPEFSDVYYRVVTNDD